MSCLCTQPVTWRQFIALAALVTACQVAVIAYAAWWRSSSETQWNASTDLASLRTQP